MVETAPVGPFKYITDGCQSAEQQNPTHDPRAKINQQLRQGSEHPLQLMTSSHGLPLLDGRWHQPAVVARTVCTTIHALALPSK